VNRPTNGTIEAAVSDAVVRFQREQLGRGPEQVRAHLVGDLIIVRCTGIFTQTEARLAVSEDGRKLIRSSRQELRSINHAEIEELIASITECAVVRSYGDVDVSAAELMEVYVLDIDMEKRLLRAELDNLSGLK